MNSQFTWDGTEIFINPTYIYNIEKETFWHFIFPYYQTIALIKKRDNKESCIIDEIKPLFSINKIGTHWKKYNSKIIILYHIDRDDYGNILYQNKLTNEYQYNIEIVKYYFFREILGLRTFDKMINIIFDKDLKIYKIIDTKENSIKYNNNTGKIKKDVLDIMLDKFSRKEVLLKATNIKINNLAESLMIFKFKIVDIINRIDNKNIFISDKIYQFLLNIFTID